MPEHKKYFFDKYTDKTSVKVTEKTVNYNLGLSFGFIIESGYLGCFFFLFKTVNCFEELLFE